MQGGKQLLEVLILARLTVLLVPWVVLVAPHKLSPPEIMGLIYLPENERGPDFFAVIIWNQFALNNLLLDSIKKKKEGEAL